MESVRGVHAVVLICRDLEAQVRFYTTVLGMALQSRAADYAFLGCGTQTLGLFALGHHPQGDRGLEGASKGLSHLEFLATREDIAKLEARLRDRAGGCFKDADGNLFHFEEIR